MASIVPDQDSIATPPLPALTGYRLLRVINHGGMSTVYLGEQTALSREVAVKVMAPQALSDEVSRRRFENEVRTIARLEHPHIVTIHEVGRTRDGLPYYSMPHMPRGHLGQRTFHKDVLAGDESRVLVIAHALLSALEYAHARGVVHRDVKAENVLFDEADRPMLADFGIALRRGFGPRVTSAGMAVGSTAYMAPEQARGEDVDGRVDLYSLTVLIWEMLTGELPYRANDALTMAVMHAQDPIPKLPPALRHWQRFMNRGLAKLPGERFGNIAQMRQAIEQIGQRRPLPGAVPARKLFNAARNRPMPVALGAGAIAILLGLFFLARDGGDGFFRAGTAATPDPVVPADSAEAMRESMLQPLPEAPLQTALENAQRQMAARNLTAPQGDNALASVLAAWEIENANPQVQESIGQLTDAFAAELVGNLRDGRTSRARDYLRHARELGDRTGTRDSEAQQRMADRIASTLQARIDRAAADFDRDAAQATAALAKEFGVTGDAAARLVARAEAIPRRGQPVPGDPAGAVMGSDGLALSPRPVSRSEYARFASATGRPAALCRERASLLRVVAHREWKSPGFQQGGNDPVVCVSMADAEAYARWYSGQTGHDYRLPSTIESRQTAAEVSGRAVSLWLRDCGTSNCNERQVRGPSWRNQQQQRSLAANRGYDDVGFRLARVL